MAVKPPRNGNIHVDVDVHIRSNRPMDGRTETSGTPGRKNLGPWHLGEKPKPRTPPPGVADADAILPAPPVILHRTPAPVEIRLFHDQSLRRYWIKTAAKLPPADREGFRIYNKRQYVDVSDGGVVLVAVEPATGQYRARLSSELHASGPLLLRDVDSGLWHPLNDVDATHVPLTDASLQPFRTDLDFSTSEPGSDGLFRHDGKLYVVIHNQAYQAMQDLDASSPSHKVWRIVNAKDPVATDSANIYRASRSGETRAITRNEAGVWVSVMTGLRGGMPRNNPRQVNMALLMQRYEPFQKAHTALIESSTQYDALWSEARQQAESPTRTAALVAVEVHLLRHIRKQTAFIQSLVDNKDWMTIVKAGGLFKEELHTFRVEHVESLNRLMAVMDLRVRPETTDLSADSCRKILTHLDKKLKFLEERQVVMEQIRKASPGAAAQLAELSQQVPTAERINFNKLTLYVHLFAGTPDQPPDTTMPSLSAIDLITGDLSSVPEREHTMALLLALDQIRGDKSRFEMLLSSQSPKDQYLEQIIALIEPIEKKIDSTLNEILDVSMPHSDLPSLDQDIDFDFIPVQPVYAETGRPAPARKMFRTRRHGTYRVLVGETETAPDGSVIIKVADPLRPDSPPRRYEKRQEEWLPVLPPIVRVPRAQLIREATASLDSHEHHMADARVQEAQKANPTNIMETLGTESDRLNEQARRLEDHASEVEDSVIVDLAARLRTAADALTGLGQKIHMRMYKDKDVLDIMRLNYLMDRAEVSVRRTVNRKALGKGKEREFLDVYSISDSTDGAPLWEAHFHYDRQDSHPLGFKTRGGHLKTLEQSRLGVKSQRRDELAGRPHTEIWRNHFDGKTAQKIFTMADNAAALSS